MTKLGEPFPKYRLSQDKDASRAFSRQDKLDEPCPKVRLSQDRMPIEPIARSIS